jgi:hypothetical protein
VGIILYIVALIVASIIFAILLGWIPVVHDLLFGVVFGLMLAWYISYTTLLYNGLQARAGNPNMVGAGPTAR